ncbi:MAG: hypothetical protein JW768_11725 [Chitinispirillaceae bacterium]|nr:hypothetical protein [Chitinispirillaceae bacterium]
MTALTIRKIPRAVEKAIREKAHSRHISLNKAVISILEDSVAGNKSGKTNKYHDLDWMCGIWNTKEFKAFKRHLTHTRKIDGEIWQ